MTQRLLPIFVSSAALLQLKGLKLLCIVFSFIISFFPLINILMYTCRVNSFMQSLLQKVSFYLCLHSMNNEDKIILSATVTA